MKFIDTHCHIAFSAFNKDRKEVVSRMKKEGMGAIEVGTTFKNSQEAVKLAEKHSFIWASIGVHPTEASTEFDEAVFKKLAKNNKVVAIGECGLDYYHKPYNEEAQKKQFEDHIKLAQDTDLPLILHCRNSHQDVIKILNGYKGKLRGTVHFFTGTEEEAEKYIELGFYIGLDGPITFVDDYDNLVKNIPLERILIETDSPYAAPAPYRGKRNEPVYVMEIAKKIAKLKNIPLKEVLDTTTKNAKELFEL